MRITARIAIVAVACSLSACTAAPRQPAATEPEEPEPLASPLASPRDEAPLVVDKVVIAPTAQMLKAALSNDPDAMREATATLACHASSSCPSQFASCTNWSTPSLCSETCSGFCICRPVWQCEDPPEPRGTDTYNSFRVCFDANQNACTEWQQTISTFCGC